MRNNYDGFWFVWHFSKNTDGIVMYELCRSRPCRKGLSPWKQADSCVVERPQRIVSVSTHAPTAQYYTILLHTVKM